MVSSIVVIGAGIQGVCISLNLIKKGFKVTLIDREDPGKSSASYGNAGHFSPYASVPINRPDVLVDVPSMLLSSTGPLALKWNYVPKMIPWFIKFIKNCSKKRMMHTAKYMHQILDLALPAYDELFEDIDISGLVESKGIIYFWTEKDLKSRQLEIDIRNELGVKQQLLTPHEIHDLEPHIKQIYHGGVLYPNARHARNPKKILLKLFESFIEKGGHFVKQNVQDINFASENLIKIKTNLESYSFDKAVIACGAFSKRFTDLANEKIPLDTERGYHVHFKGNDHLLSRPVIFLNRGFGITPMEQGLRVVGTVEFGGLNNPPSKKRIQNLINNARYLFPVLGKHEDEWLGFRPTLPDFLPIIGQSKNIKIYFILLDTIILGGLWAPFQARLSQE
tara:strand:- start:2709 stop:3887 length:1179 start_codon:yes stop_codon:yes gene_type:complete